MLTTKAFFSSAHVKRHFFYHKFWMWWNKLIHTTIVHRPWSDKNQVNEKHSNNKKKYAKRFPHRLHNFVALNKWKGYEKKQVPHGTMKRKNKKKTEKDSKRNKNVENGKMKMRSKKKGKKIKRPMVLINFALN